MRAEVRSIPNATVRDGGATLSDACGSCCSHAAACGAASIGVCCGAAPASACCPFDASCVQCARGWRCSSDHPVSLHTRCAVCGGDDLPIECLQRRQTEEIGRGRGLQGVGAASSPPPWPPQPPTAPSVLAWPEDPYYRSYYGTVLSPNSPAAQHMQAASLLVSALIMVLMAIGILTSRAVRKCPPRPRSYLL